MKLVFLNRFAWPELAATAQHLADLSEELAAAGHEVHVACSAGRYRDEAPPPPRRETHRGVRYARLGRPGRADAGFAARLARSASYHLRLAWWLWWNARDASVVVALTDPPALGLHGAWLRLATFGRVRSVVWCMDLLTDAAQALGLLRPGGAPARLLGAVELAALRRADRVVALGECMAKRLRSHGLRAERIDLIGPWADGAEIERRTPGEGRLRAELGLTGRFVVMYSGNAGRVHDFESTCAAMLRLRGAERIRFVFAGGGPRTAELEAFVAREGLTNALFLPYFPREELGEALGLADVHLVTLRRGMEGVVVPSKLPGALAAGRPVLAVAPGASTIAREPVRAGAGFALLPEDADGLVTAIRRLEGEPALADRMGRRARARFEERHERRLATARFRALLASLASC